MIRLEENEYILMAMFQRESRQETEPYRQEPVEDE